MAEQCYALIRYQGDGTTDDFSVPFPYLRKEHVFITVGEDTLGTGDYTWTSPQVVHLNAVPAPGVEVVVRRITPRADLIDRLNAPSTLSAQELNLIFTQLLYLIQEALCAGLDLAEIDWLGALRETYDVALAGVDLFEEGDIIGPVPVTRPVTFLPSATGSQGHAILPPSEGEHVFTILVNNNPTGTITIASDGTVTFSTPGAILAPGDWVALETTTAGPGINNVGITLRMRRNDLI